MWLQLSDTGTVVLDLEKVEIGRGSLGGSCNSFLKFDFILNDVGSLWRVLCRMWVCVCVAGMPVCRDLCF